MNENPLYLTEQLITYIGNKRSLLPFIKEGIEIVQKGLGKQYLHCFDVFSGSGIVSRFLKSVSLSITVNDLEYYSKIINSCYLENKSYIKENILKEFYEKLVFETQKEVLELEELKKQGIFKSSGFISELYSPKDEENIQKGERCFYTNYNANYIDIISKKIKEDIPLELQHFFIAPLLSEVSIHANTSGIFKGFYKNSSTGKGQFGGNGKNALERILKKIELPFPVFSNFECPFFVYQEESNKLASLKALYDNLPEKEFDLVYIDPPYNQHPYGSNYFMLNLVANYKRPELNNMSKISGIPNDWNRSSFNKKKKATSSFFELINLLKSKYLMISFNSEGYISKEEIVAMLSKVGTVTVLEIPYNTYRASRNLKNRDIYVKEYLFIVKKSL